MVLRESLRHLLLTSRCCGGGGGVFQVALHGGDESVP